MSGFNTESVIDELIEKLIPQPLSALSTKLTYDLPRLPYKKHRDISKYPKTNWGQRKLLLGEIKFLTLYADKEKGSHVLYVGAAPGDNIPYLQKLFPKCTFELYDPRPKFNKQLIKANTRNIQVNIAAFNNTLAEDYAKKYKNKHLLFISDIRNNSVDDPHIKLNLQEREKLIQTDMRMQKEWVKIIKPYMSMLKFRISFITTEIEYLDGDIYFQPWAPQESVELRLITDGKKLTVYNGTIIEEIMSYINNKLRPFVKYRINDRTGTFNAPYDTALEYIILEEYFKKYNDNDSLHADYRSEKSQVTSHDTIEMITSMMKETSQFLGDPEWPFTLSL